MIYDIIFEPMIEPVDSWPSVTRTCRQVRAETLPLLFRYFRSSTFRLKVDSGAYSCLSAKARGLLHFADATIINGQPLITIMRRLVFAVRASAYRRHTPPKIRSVEIVVDVQHFRSPKCVYHFGVVCVLPLDKYGRPWMEGGAFRQMWLDRRSMILAELVKYNFTTSLPWANTDIMYRMTEEIHYSVNGSYRINGLSKATAALSRIYWSSVGKLRSLAT